LSLEKIANANEILLKQGLVVLNSLSNELYIKTGKLDVQSSIGPHVRHVAEFYDCLRQDLEQNCVDYSERSRDVRTEKNIDHARSRLRAIISWLARLANEEDERLRVRHEPMTPSVGGNASSIGRELEFLLSHTTHHFAMIALILRSIGVDVPKDFGFSPSTLLYLQACEGEEESALG